MKNLPVAIRCIINLILFVIYSFIGIIFGSFLFGLILTMMGKRVPGSSDPVHMKVAGIVILIVLIKTIILRKYFYISVELYKNNDIKIQDEKKMEILVDKEIKEGS